jgi:non-specific serine/threonine protein kinase
MLEEGVEWLADVLQRTSGTGQAGAAAGDRRTRAATFNGLGVLVSIGGDSQRGAGYFTESIALYERTGDLCGLSRAWTHLGNARAIVGDPAGSAEAFDRGLAIAKRSGELWYEAFVIYLAGFAATIRGDTALARAAMVESSGMFARAGDHRAVGYAQMVLGGCLVVDGCWADALSTLREAMRIFDALPERWGLLTGASMLAAATAESGDWPQTATVVGVIDTLSERISAQLFPHMQAAVDALAARASQELGRTDGIAAALWPSPAAGRPGQAVTDLPLSRREREVAGLITEGLTNREIGERLFIAERTVDTHVAHILAKLGCASRSQVAAIVAASQAASPMP